MERTRLLLLPLLALGGCLLLPPANGPSGPHPWDVSGNYNLTFDGTYRLTLQVGGVSYQAQPNQAGVVDFGTIEGKPVVLDWSAFCARPEVVCPHEALWNRVAIEQKDRDKKMDVYLLDVIDNRVANLPVGQKAQSLAGLHNHADSDKFLVGISGASAGSGSCGALAVSLADGRFTRDLDQRPTGIADGRVGLAWLGACALPGQLVAVATLTVETGFVGTRTGDFNPPPYAEPPPLQLDAGVEPPADLASRDGGASD